MGERADERVIRIVRTMLVNTYYIVGACLDMNERVIFIAVAALLDIGTIIKAGLSQN